MEKLEQEKCNHVKPSGSYTEIGTEEEDCKETSHVKGEMITKKKRDIQIIGVSQGKYNFSVSMGDISCPFPRSEEHTSELQSRGHLVCRLLLEKKKKKKKHKQNP